MGKLKFARRSERGANLVEFALVLVVLLLLVLGAADIGRAFHNYTIITNSAREGARYASHFPHYARGIRDATIQEAASSGVDLVDSDILISPEPPLNADPRDPVVAQPGEPIWVGVEYRFTTLMGSLVGLEEFMLRSANKMVVFGQDQQ